MGYDHTRLKALLSETGYDVAYDHFVSKPDLPFVLIQRTRTVNHYADNRVHAKVNHFRVILATERKDSTAERAVESVFNRNEIPWEIEDEVYVKDQRVHQVFYETEEIETFEEMEE